jgi:hypothetical protein
MAPEALAALSSVAEMAALDPPDAAHTLYKAEKPAAFCFVLFMACLLSS